VASVRPLTGMRLMAVGDAGVGLIELRAGTTRHAVSRPLREQENEEVDGDQRPGDTHGFCFGSSWPGPVGQQLADWLGARFGFFDQAQQVARRPLVELRRSLMTAEDRAEVARLTGAERCLG